MATPYSREQELIFTEFDLFGDRALEKLTEEASIDIELKDLEKLDLGLNNEDLENLNIQQLNEMVQQLPVEDIRELERKILTAQTYEEYVKDIEEKGIHEGRIEEGKQITGRRFIRWNFVKGLTGPKIRDMMRKIEENVKTSFYMRHSFAVLLVKYEMNEKGEEEEKELVFWKNVGSPWIKTYEKAEKWLTERENARLLMGEVQRPDTKWKFKDWLQVDLKVVLDRDPLLGTGPLPDWLRNLAHTREMMALDTYKDNLCLWRCIAVHHGARPDRSTAPAKSMVRGYYKIKNVPRDWKGKTSMDDLEKVEEYLNRGKRLEEWEGIRVYEPEVANAEEMEFDEELKPKLIWHLVRNPAPQIKNVITIGHYNEHAFYIKDISKLAKTYECNHCHSRFTKTSDLYRHEATCSQGKTVLNCPGAWVEAPQTAYEKAFYPKSNASRESIQWVEYVAKRWKMEIAHAMSGGGGERWIERNPVDGYNHKRKLVLQYHGCNWHGCPRCYKNREKVIDKKTVEERYESTQKRTAYLREKGYKVVECWGCQWKVPGGYDPKAPIAKAKTKTYPHAILYDFEAYGDTNQRKNQTERLVIESKHVPISVSIGDTMEKDAEGNPKVTHICETNPKVLVQKFMEELGRREKKISAKVRAENIPADMEQIPREQRKKIEEWCNQVPALGFNSGSYDLNLIRNYFAEQLAGTAKKVKVAKMGSKIMFLLTDRLRFLDIINYLGPGTSYDSWIKAYGCKVTKSWFPYEWFDSAEKLDYPGLPDYMHWFSKLKNGYTLSLSEWKSCKETFRAKGMKTFKDWLEYYNNLDVAPGLEALERMKAFYAEKGIDILKDAVSIPGVSLHYLLRGSIERGAELYAPSKEAYEMLKGAVVGGPSLVFTRYHEVGRTRIRSHQYAEPRLCKNILGYDANALYLSTMKVPMACGKERVEHKEDEELAALILTKQIKANIKTNTQTAWFGYAEVDIQIPKRLQKRFEEMCPFFHNEEVPEEAVPEHMKEYMKATGRKRVAGNKKLLGSMKAQKILLYEPLLRWYIAHGAEITKVYRTIEYEPKVIFDWFVEEVTEARRTGDVDKSKALLADVFKLLGNSAYGKLIEALERQTNVYYTKDEKVVDRAMRSAFFEDLDEIGEAYELESRKVRVTIRRPFQVGIAVYQLAKLRMLEFYYDFMDRYFDRRDFELIQMDTDSNYMAISAKTLEEIVKPEMREEFEAEKKNWLAWDKWSGRTPGLFKKEFEGERMIALCSKCYYADDRGQTKKKLSSKGMSKRQNEITWQRFKAALDNKKVDMATNRGFRMREGKMATYVQEKLGLSAYYDKRWVLPDGIHTEPIDYHRGVAVNKK